MLYNLHPLCFFKNTQHLFPQNYRTPKCSTTYLPHPTELELLSIHLLNNPSPFNPNNPLYQHTQNKSPWFLDKFPQFSTNKQVPLSRCTYLYNKLSQYTNIANIFQTYGKFIDPLSTLLCYLHQPPSSPSSTHHH